MLKHVPTFLKTSFLLLLLLLASFYLANRDSKSPSNYFLGSQNAPKSQQQVSPKTYEITNPELTNLPGHWAIAVKDLKRDDTYLLNADLKFPSASIYKLAVMYKVYDSIGAGELKKEDVVSGEKSELDQILSGIESPQEPTATPQMETRHVSMSTEEALRLMITISDNYATILLAEHLGWKKIDDFLEAQNLAGIDLVQKDAPTTTARATMELLERIYKKTAVDTDSSTQMLDLLLAQKINDRIPKYLPPSTRVGHKTGELGAVRHDAGIVIGAKGDYIFVFLTETANPQEAAENIAKLSKRIYDALEAQE